MPDYSYNKKQRLKSRKSIETIFRNGRSISSPPFRLLYRESDQLPYPVLMTVAVPKRQVKRAVDRNLLKRRTREAYRLKKPDLLKAVGHKNTGYEIVFLYQSSEILDYQQISRSVSILLSRFETMVLKNNGF